MGLKFHRSFLIILSITSAIANAQTNKKQIRILWGNFSRPWSVNLLESEFKKPIKSQVPVPAATVVKTDLTSLGSLNPFGISPTDFFIGTSRPYSGQTMGQVPEISVKDSSWFDQQIKNQALPDVFFIAGHQVISEGWHNHIETMFLNLPTLLDTVNRYPSAKQVFDNVKFAVLWGCNTMTDLEPRGLHGEYLSPEEIKKIYDSGDAGKKYVVGTADKVNTLEFYRSRLARGYGPGGAHYEYTRDRNSQKCLGPGKYDDCKITNLQRIMPDSYLYDGSHLYDYPYMMKKLFPNAALVLGYSSASPSEEIRVQILSAVINKSYVDVNAALATRKINNLLLPLVDPAAPDDLKVTIIKALRKNWTVLTDSMNNGRPSGSITPAFPEIDVSGILGAPLSHGSPQYGPYEAR